MHLTANPDIRRRASEEVKRVSPSGPLTLEQLRELTYLSQVLMEVKRMSPVVPAMFAVAKEACERAVVAGLTVVEQLGLSDNALEALAGELTA